jgi:hypothetical protein
MIILSIISLSILLIHICGGGLIIESLFTTSLLLNTTALYQAYLNHKKNRLSNIPIAISTSLLFLVIAFFFLPLFNKNQNNAAYYYSAQNLLIEGSQLAFFDLPSFAFTNTLNLNKSLQILVLLLNLPPLVYLCAHLKHQHKIYLAYIITILGLCNILAVLYQQNIRDTGGYIWWLWDSQAGKSFASFVNPNHFGAYCAALLGIPVCQFFDKLKKKKYQSLSIPLVMIIFIILGIMLSASMGAYILGLISLFLSYLFCYKQNSTTPIKTFFILIIVLTFSTLTPFQIKGELDERGLHDNTRKELFATVPTVIADFPLGVGPGAYGDVSPSYTGAIHSSNYFHHSENTYFNIIQEFGLFFFFILIFLNGSYINQVLDNIRKKKISSNLAAFCTIALLVFLCHASYDYGFHIPIYAFHIAVFYGLMLTKGKTYKLNYHSKNQFIISKVFLLSPLILIIVSSVVWLNFNEDLSKKKSFRQTAKLNTTQLSHNISHSPMTWYQWYFLGLRVLQQDSEDFLRMDFAEKCFRKAAHYAPINKDSWYMLFMLRDQLGRDQEAKEAYLFYFKLLKKNEREQYHYEAMDVLELNDQEYEQLQFLEHAPIDFDVSKIRKI